MLLLNEQRRRHLDRAAAINQGRPHEALLLYSTSGALWPARTAQVGQRQTVQQEEYFCHAFNKDGLVGIAFVDEAYPARAGFCVVSRCCPLRYSTLICL